MFYNIYTNNEKIVNEDELCEQFEEEKFCWICEHYQPKTLNNGYCKLDESKTIRCGAYICDKNI